MASVTVTVRTDGALAEEELDVWVGMLSRLPGVLTVNVDRTEQVIPAPVVVTPPPVDVTKPVSERV